MCQRHVSVKAVTSKQQMFPDKKVVANKQNAAGRGVEQSADLAKVFRLCVCSTAANSQLQQ